MSFTKFDLFDQSTYPATSGAYNIILWSRDEKPVIRVLYFDREAYESCNRDNMWIRAEVSEYGYFHHEKVNPDYICAYQKIEGADFNLVPEIMNINIDNIL